MIKEKLKKGKHHDECKIGRKMSEITDNDYCFKKDYEIIWEIKELKSKNEVKDE